MTSRTPAPTPTAEAEEVVAFWVDAGPSLWFAKNADFDRRFREAFVDLHEAAARGELNIWLAAATGALALVLLLDQYPRNAFRDTPRMYATDGAARDAARAALAAGHNRVTDPRLQLFLYLPFSHSELLADQQRAVSLMQSLGEPASTHARRHHDIVARFGRFPHRNAILGRASRPAELQYLAGGGYAG